MPAGVPLGGIAGGARRVRLAERAAAGSGRLMLALWGLVLGATLLAPDVRLYRVEGVARVRS